MKTKYLFFAASALVALASCSSNDFAGDQSLLENSGGGGAISFGFDVPTPTRASGATAAGLLNNQFVVYAEKNETGEAAPTAGNLVINNYVVNYVTNSAYTSTSNTKDWEYVGFKFNDNSATISTENYSTNITPNSGAGEQTIKYWDYAANNYVFTAVSAKPADIAAGRVKIKKLTAGTSTVYDKGYEITLAKDASDYYPSLADLYFADRVKIGDVEGDKTGKDRTATNKYGGNVQFTFRNALSQVRAGVYETIPGYEVSEIKFYKTDGTTEYKQSETSAFGAVCPNVSATNFEGTVTATYYNETNTQNHPKIVVTPNDGLSKTDLVLGTNFSTLTVGSTEPAIAAKYLGTTATAPTYDTNDGSFTSVLPQVNNTTSLKLKVNYKLYNTVTKEIIQVTGKTAEIPSQYLQWKPNFKYTYLFKITDDELYPITFDAVTIEAEDGTVEYITTVTEPSITTFGVNSTTGKYVTGGSEYAAGSDIYATIMDGSSVADFTFNSQAAGGVNVYLATTTDAAKYPITEASVAEALAEISTGTKKITYTIENTNASSKFTAVPAEVTTVPGEDGVDITGTHALKLTGAKATTETTALVVEYIKTPATYHTSSSNYTFEDADAMAAEVSANGQLYSNATGTTVATWVDASEHTYYRRTAVNSVGEYAYKVIRVQ